jgi:sodium-dependent phosphate cotransporter
VGELSAVSVAFAHLLFNTTGIALIWPIPAVRRLPITLSVRLTRIALYNRIIPVLWVIFFFYIMPFVVILGLR